MDQMNLTEEARSYLEEAERTRGYTLDFHRIMAAADFAWLRKYNAFIEATYTGQRTLDRKTKELLQVAVEAALRADVEQIQEHVRLALAARRNAPGGPRSPGGCHCAPMGALAFRRGLQAWAAEVGVDPDRL